ncbi:hypothetical protein ACKS0A_05002 [Histoplasma ohiense]
MRGLLLGYGAQDGIPDIGEEGGDFDDDDSGSGCSCGDSQKGVRCMVISQQLACSMRELKGESGKEAGEHGGGGES